MANKILLVSQSDGAGGAARAAYRLFLCLSRNNLSVNFMVSKKVHKDEKIIELTKFRKLLGAIYSRIDYILGRIIEPNNSHWKSVSFFGVISARFLNKRDFELINFHWLGHGMMSLRQIRKVNKPIVWTIHDEWLINPISHYANDNKNSHPRGSKFAEKIRELVKMRVIINKRKLVMMDSIYFVSVSSEMQNRMIKKFPLVENRICTIPNPVDLDLFFPDNDSLIYGSKRPANPIVLFLGGSSDKRKGWDLLKEALIHCESNFTLVITDNIENFSGLKNNIQILSIGRISSIDKLRKLYSTSSLVVVPSRAEGLPQVATESISCGVPVLSFNVGGLPDVVIDNLTGIKVEPFDTKTFGHVIDKFIVGDIQFSSQNLRNFATQKFSFESIDKQYNFVLDQALKRYHKVK